MRPLFDARIEDLGPGDFLKVECAACGHDEMIPKPRPHIDQQRFIIVDTRRVFDCEKQSAEVIRLILVVDTD